MSEVYEGKPIEWRWVLVGMLIVLGLQSLLVSLLAVAGVDFRSLGLLAGTTTVSFLGGGILIGWLSPGYTPWEGGFASGLAAVGSILVTTSVYSAAHGIAVLIPIAGLWGLLCGLVGGKLGELIQGE